jgi:hypothetical protein
MYYTLHTTRTTVAIHGTEIYSSLNVSVNLTLNIDLLQVITPGW